MNQLRVSELPPVGVEGIEYVLEPGNVSYTWDSQQDTWDPVTIGTPVEGTGVTLDSATLVGNDARQQLRFSFDLDLAADTYLAGAVLLTVPCNSSHMPDEGQPVTSGGVAMDVVLDPDADTIVVSLVGGQTIGAPVNLTGSIVSDYADPVDVPAAWVVFEQRPLPAPYPKALGEAY